MNDTTKTGGNFLAISILVAALIIAGTLIYVFGPGKGPGGQLNNTGDEEIATAGQPPAIGDDYVLGDANAPVTIIEFGDYQCPFCGRFFNQTEPQIRENYVKTGKVKFVYKDLIIIDGFVAGGHDSKKCLAEVEGATKEAEASLPQLSTPATFVNKQLVSGAVPYEQFASVIEEELKQAR